MTGVRSSVAAALADSHEPPPLVVHVIHALRVGGLENGLVNLINNMDDRRYRHAIVCMTESTDFRHRIKRSDVEVVALHKENLGRAAIVRALYDYFRSRGAAIVHGRNWDGLDAVLPAWLAGVPVRIQGEHGRDMHDLDGSNRKLRWLRRLNRPLTSHYTTVSRDLADYLVGCVGVSRARISQIYNGVDTVRFHPRDGQCAQPILGEMDTPDRFVVGTVGRMVPVKDQLTLVRACARLVVANPSVAKRLRLVIVGDGPLRSDLEREAVSLGIGDRMILPGATDSVAEWLRAMDLFVLPSLAEGISNTVLEAMATGIPVIATDVGGNADLVVDGRTGCLAKVGDAQGLSEAIWSYVADDRLCRIHGDAARLRAESSFSIRAMVDGYTALYDRLLAASGRSVRGAATDSPASA